MPVPLRLSGISKTFGTTAALTGVSFDVRAGEVHALLGENGAGKSTLMHIAYGMLRADAGEVIVTNGARTERFPRGFASPLRARGCGIGMVHQHFTSIPAFSVGENVALAAGWPETGRHAERRAAEVSRRLGLPLDARALVESLSVQLRQRLEIVGALAANARVLLLDEPSAVLAPREVRELLQVVRDFAGRGGAVVLITHKLEDVFAAANRVTVLRRGIVTRSSAVVDETPHSLARAMIGGDLPAIKRAAAVRGEVQVHAADLRLASRRGRGLGVIAGPMSFSLYGGEVIGVAAIDGNGQRQLLRAIAGLDDACIVAGSLDVARPVAFIPEDRTTEGIVPDLTLAENVQLGAGANSARWIDWGAVRSRTARLLALFDVRAAGPDARAATLSGGNQQKLVFARAFDRAPRVLVAEDPTRGLDVQATQSIHERLRAMAAAGATVIVHSSDLDEVLAVADRIFVVAHGTLRELPADCGRDDVGDAMVGLRPVA